MCGLDRRISSSVGRLKVTVNVSETFVFTDTEQKRVKQRRRKQSVGREGERRRGNFFLLISYLWICLDAGECSCADFKHYLISQTSLLMCGDQRQRQRLPNEDGGAGWSGRGEGGGVLMRMTVAFQSKSGKVLLSEVRSPENRCCLTQEKNRRSQVLRFEVPASCFCSVKHLTG